MSAFSFSPRARAGRSLTRKNSSTLNLEALEQRALMSCNTISGFVYHDVNNNGLFDPGEQPIANSKVELRNASNVVVATDVTDVNGRYDFSYDQTVDQTPQTLTKTVEFPVTQTNFNLEGLLDQFDPSLGELKEVQITHAGSITSEIKVENTSLPSGSPIAGTVSGNLTLVAPGVNDKLALSEYAGSIAAKAFDGTIDFQGTSGASFGKKTADGTNAVTLTGDAVKAYVGTGKVKVTEKAEATSRADGGGNFIANIESTATARITVKYKFVPGNCLSPGNYTIVQTEQPPGFVDGKESQAGSVLTNPVGTDSIPVVLNGQDLENNNFGELKAASLSGHVYFDADNDGVKDPGEQGIPGAKVELSGFDDLGPVTKSATTAPDGSYKFDNLRPGTYSLAETQPAGYTDGKDKLGSLGGTLQNDQVLNVQVASGQDGTDYDFGEIKPSGLSGHVWADRNDNGQRDPGEEGILGVKVTLTGTTSEGQSVTKETTTDPGGAYKFDNLQPGEYTLTETQPANYDDGKDKLGSLGGELGNDVFSKILLGMGQSGINYDFGEKPRETSDLGIVKKASASVSKVGENLTYTLSVTNFGADVARDVVVTDQLPSNVTYVSASGTGWAVGMTGGVVTATRPSLAVGATSQIVVVVKVPNAPATLTNVTEVTSTTPDNNPNNNRSTVTTTVINTPPPNPGPQNIPPLVTQFGQIPILSKNQLFNNDPLTYLDPTLKGQMTFVDGVNRTLTGGSASMALNLQQIQKLRTGGSRNQIIGEVWNSNAHRVQQANALYKTYLKRSPTGAEQASAIQAFKSGKTELQLAEAILTSEDYQKLHPPGQLAAGLYQDVYGKPPTAAAAQQLAQSMNNSPLNQVVRGMLTSQGALENAVQTVYRTTLRRHASAAEVQQWAGQLAAGSLTTAQLQQRLLASDEFYQLAFNAAK